MNDNQLGFLVVRRGIDQDKPWQVGDPVTTYELAEPWPYGDLPPHSGVHIETEVYRQMTTRYANTPTDWREQQVLRCDCKPQRAIAHLLVHEKSARLWLTFRPEKVPSALRRPDDHRDIEGYPLHGTAGEAPHIHGVASCNACRARWLVVSFVDRAELIRIKRVAHGASIAE